MRIKQASKTVRHTIQKIDILSLKQSNVEKL